MISHLKKKKTKKNRAKNSQNNVTIVASKGGLL
jgi:hypothetical protein